MRYFIGINKTFGIRSKFVCLERYSKDCGEYLQLIDDPLADYIAGRTEPNYPVPAIAKCYCGYSIEAHRDHIPCDWLGFFNYG